LCLDRNDLISDQFQNSVDDRLKALENFLVGESHVTFFNRRFGILGLNTNVDRPLLTVVAEIGLYPVLKVHDTLGVDFASSLGSIRKFHLTNLGAENVGKVAVQRSGTARVSRTSCTFSHSEWRLFFDFVGDQIDSTTTTIDDQQSIVDFQVEQTSLGAEHGSCFGLSDEGQAVVVLITEETSLNGCRSGSSFASIVPNSRHGQEISNVPLFSVEHLSQSLLKLVSHRLSQLEQVVGCDVNLGFSWRKRGQVDGVYVGVAAQHQLQFEPFDFLDTWLRITSRRKSLGDIGTPTDNLLVLIIVENRRDLPRRACQQRTSRWNQDITIPSTVATYLLLCLSTRARPFDDDIFLGFRVGCECECDTGKGGSLRSDE
jgi:hypothetical protein